MARKTIATEELTLLVDMARTQECVFAVDARYRIMYLSEQAEALLGYQAGDVIGRRCSEALHFSSRTGLRTCISCTRMLPGSSTQPASGRFEITATKRSGARVPLRVLVLPAYNAAGQLRLVHIIREIVPGESAVQDGRETLDDIAGELQPAGENGLVGNGADEGLHGLAHKNQLTRREQEVLQLLASGLSTADIAISLSISPVTARNHVTSIMEKVGAKTRLQAVVIASRRGLILRDSL